MKTKKLVYILLLSVISFAFSSCKVYQDWIYVFVQNNTSQAVNVTIEEDPETATSIKYGPITCSYSVGSGQKVKTSATSDDYYRVLVNDELVHWRNDTHNVGHETDEYYLLVGNPTVVTIAQDSEGFYFTSTIY